jgi:hypothetical protein
LSDRGRNGGIGNHDYLNLAPVQASQSQILISLVYAHHTHTRPASPAHGRESAYRLLPLAPPLVRCGRRTDRTTAEERAKQISFYPRPTPLQDPVPHSFLPSGILTPLLRHAQCNSPNQTPAWASLSSAQDPFRPWFCHLLSNHLHQTYSVDSTQIQI